MFSFIKKAFTKAVNFIKEAARSVYSNILQAVSSIASVFRPRVIGTNHQSEAVVV